MSETKKQDAKENHPEGIRLGNVTVLVNGADGKQTTVKTTGKYYINGG